MRFVNNVYSWRMRLAAIAIERMSLYDSVIRRYPPYLRSLQSYMNDNILSLSPVSVGHQQHIYSMNGGYQRASPSTQRRQLAGAIVIELRLPRPFPSSSSSASSSSSSPSVSSSMSSSSLLPSYGINTRRSIWWISVH